MWSMLYHVLMMDELRKWEVRKKYSAARSSAAGRFS